VLAATATEVNRAVINIGSGQELQIGDLAAQIALIAGKQADVLHSPGQSGGVSRLVADVTTARRLLGWVPRTGLDQGLRLTLERDLRFQQDH
jgi:UDP-glucose 4-epimerase